MPTRIAIFSLLLGALLRCTSALGDDGGYQSVDVCFALDTTGSMSNLIETAKEKIWFVANAIVAAPQRPSVRYCLMAYRDRGDAYVTKHLDLTEDLDGVFEALTALEADGGGDFPEAVNQALRETIEQSTWRNATHTLKIIFLVGDAPPHADREPSSEHIAQLAASKGIIINTVLCGNNTDARQTWAQIATAGEGLSADIGTATSRAVPQTVVDQDLVALNTRLGTLLVPYGAPEQQSAITAKQTRAEEMSDAAIADRLAYNAALGKAVLGSGELVADIDAGIVDLEQLDQLNLPEALGAMSREQLIKHLGSLRQQRTAIQRLVTELAAERHAIIRRTFEADENSFEVAVSTMIERQLSATARGNRG